jgi:hypothetical protein
MPVRTWVGFGRTVLPERLTATYHSAINSAATDSGNTIDPIRAFIVYS